MSETRRKVYKPDFKAKVGIEAIRGRKRTNELGQEYGVHPGKTHQKIKINF